MRRRAAIAAVVAALVPFAFVARAEAKSYRFDSIRIDVVVAPDGTFRVSEQRTFRFDGSFRRAFLRIPRGRMLLDDVRVVEGSRVYRQGTREAEISGTYSFTALPSSYEIWWFYDAANESRTFTVSYRVSGQIVAYDDVAELYWQFVGGQWDVPSSDIVATVRLPAGATRDQIRAWGHGPLEGRVDIVDARTVTWRLDDLPARTFMEGRVTFPTSLVPQAPRTARERLPDIVVEERQLADEANAARARTRWANIGAGALGVAAFGLFLWLFFRYGKEPGGNTAPNGMRMGEYIWEPPADYSPAIVGWLMRFGRTKTVDIVATLMDLARRGVLKIDETVEREGVIFKRDERRYVMTVDGTDRRSMSSYERTIVSLLEEAGGRQITDEELRDWGKSNPERMKQVLDEFSTEVNAQGVGLGMLATRWYVIAVNVVAGAVAVGVGVIVLFSRDGDAPGAVLALGLGAVQLALSRLLQQRTRMGAAHYRAWKAFGRFLKDYSHMNERRPVEVALWEKYLVYAIPLGVADEVTKALQIHEPELAAQGFSWYSPGFVSHDVVSMPSAFASSFSEMTHALSASTAAAFSTPSSSGDGSGGGFSGGGDGGGGDGGGGGGGGGGAD